MSHNYGYDYMAIVTDGATSYWRLDQDWDCLVDKSRQYASSTAGGSVTDILPAANNNGSTGFNGSTDYVEIDYLQLKNGETTGAGDFSIECWVRPGADQSATDFIGIAVKNGSFGLCLNYGKPAFFTQLSGASKIVAASSTAVSTNTNYHLVGTYNSSTGDLKMYVNGSLVNTTNTGSTGNAINQTSSSALAVGSWDTSVLFFHGNIANVALYDGAVLSSTQVSNHHGYAG